MKRRKRYVLTGNELVSISHTNESEGHRFSDYRISVRDCGLDEGSPVGDLYRLLRREYGRCKSKVYIDTPDGAAHIGWYFESREEYEDANRAYFHGDKAYLRGTWARLERATDLPPYEPVVIG